MDLDNITDIEMLRNIAKKHMVKAKQDFYAEDGTLYKFKKDHWYDLEQDEYGVTVFSTDGKSYCIFTYDNAKEYLYSNEEM